MAQFEVASNSSLSIHASLMASSLESLPKPEQVKSLDGLTALLFFMAFLTVLAFKR